MPIVDGFEANRILQSVTFGSNKEHTIATDNYASAREWIGVEGTTFAGVGERPKINEVESYSEF